MIYVSYRGIREDDLGMWLDRIKARWVWRWYEVYLVVSDIVTCEPVTAREERYTPWYLLAVFL